MTVDTTTAQNTEQPRTSSVARTVVAVVGTLLIAVSVWLLAGLSMNWPAYEFNWVRAIAGVTALLGFLGLIAVKARWGYYLATLIVTAIPGVLALGFLLLNALFTLTDGTHTLARSGDILSFGFSFTAPFFLPPIVAGVLLLIRKRPIWVKVLVVVVGIGVLYALCVYRGLFG